MRIAVFDAVGSYFSAPTLRCMLEEFDYLGIGVDVYSRCGGEHLASVSRARACPFPVPFRAWLGDWRNTLRQWKWFLKYRGFAGYRILGCHRYDLSIGLNPEGVIAAYRLWKRTGTPFVYLSFELQFRDELKELGLLRLKDEEVVASRRAGLIVIQDLWRARLLAEENGLSAREMVFLPVAPRGVCGAPRANYLRERLSIRPGKTILLHAGAFKSFTDADRLMDCLPLWPQASRPGGQYFLRECDR